jgi:tetratricopeptide (TPR) repeat protein
MITDCSIGDGLQQTKNQVKLGSVGYFKMKQIWLGMILMLVFSPWLAFAEKQKQNESITQVRDILSRAHQAADAIEDVSEEPILLIMFTKSQAGEKIEILNDVAILQATAGDDAGSKETFERVRQVIHSLKSDDLKSTTLSNFIEAQATVGNIDNALQTLDLIDVPEYRIYLLLKIAAVQFMRQDQSGAKRTLQKAFAEGHNPEIRPPFSLFTHIAVAQARAGDIEGALKTVPFVMDHAKGYVLAEIAAAKIRSGDAEGAAQIAASDKGGHDKGLIFYRMAQVQRELGKRTDAEESLRQAVQVAKDIKAEKLLVQAAEGYSSMQLFEKAFEVIESIGDELKKAAALNQVIANLHQGTDPKSAASILQRAAQIANALQGGLRKETSLISIAEAQLQNGDPQAALLTVSGVDLTIIRSYNLERVARLQEKAGDTIGGRRTLKLAFEASKRPERRFDGVNASTMVRAQAQIGDMIGAKQTVKATNGSDPYAMIELAAAQAELGDLVGAFDTIKPIQNLNQRAQALGRLAEEQVKLGQGPEAELSLQQAFLLTYAIESFSERTRAFAEVFQKQLTVGYLLRQIGEKRAKDGKLNEALGLSDNLKLPYLRACILLGIAEGLLEQEGRKPPRIIKLYDPPIS